MRKLKRLRYLQYYSEAQYEKRRLNMIFDFQLSDEIKERIERYLKNHPINQYIVNHEKTETQAVQD